MKGQCKVVVAVIFMMATTGVLTSWAIRQPPDQLDALLLALRRDTAVRPKLQETDVPDRVHSLSPPTRQPYMHGTAENLVIGIACGIRSVPDVPLADQPLMDTLLPSIEHSLHPDFEYRFYFTFDANDPVFDVASTQHAIGVAVQTRCNRTVTCSTHWVLCTRCEGSPSVAHNNAAIAAFLEGADYVFRVNDDTQLPADIHWTHVFTNNLANRRPIPNFGVVGPDFDFNVVVPILSHDFTHWTHAKIHGFHYPPTLPNWSADDWITYVYDQFNATMKLAQVKIVHNTKYIRYGPSDTEVRQAALDAALAAGTAAIDKWTAATHGLTLLHVTKQYRTP